MDGAAQVVIVGAGPVGLATAIELGLRGVSVLVVERQARAGWHPRAKTTHVRTAEHLRRWGIIDRFRELAPLPPNCPPDLLFKTRLFGYELARFENAFFTSRARDERYSEHGQWIPQYKVEQVLREKAESLPNVTLRQGVEFVALEQGEHRVAVTLQHVADGPVETLEADYLVGADGVGSAVRRALGIAMKGERDLGDFVNVIARCPQLSRDQPEPRGFVYWIVNPQSPGAIGQMDKDDIWAFISALPRGVKLDEAQVRERIDAAVGCPVQCDILAIDYWTASRAGAESYGGGRVFLAGDACHVHPPFGGYGMNMGIADAVDIGWKLAATVQGWGGPGLLASYEAERRPVHEAVMDEAVNNMALQSTQLLHDKLEEDSPEGAEIRRRMGEGIAKNKAAEFHTLGIVLGVHYSGSPVVVDDGTRPPPLTTLYTPSAHPGCLAPHTWLADGSSLYDHFGEGFTLLLTGSLGDDGDVPDEDVLRIQEAFADRRIPLRTIAPQSSRLRELYCAPLVLIRPDQHVAWRGDGRGVDFKAIAARVSGHSG